MKIIDVRLFLPKTNSYFNDNGSAQRSSYRAWVITCASPIQCTSSTLTRRSVPPGWGRDRNTQIPPCTVPGTRPRFNASSAAVSWNKEAGSEAPAVKS